MTPQQSTKLHTSETSETCRKMMKTTVHRRHSRHTVIKAFSKNSDTYKTDHVPQNAELLMEDHAHLTVGLETQERLLLLFTDSLIIAKTKSLYLKLKARVSLCDIWLASCIHLVTSRKFSAKNSFVIGWPTTNYVVTLSSSETKEKWFRALQWHSGRARQSLTPNRILLNVRTLDHQAMTPVTVDMNSTADSVIQSLFHHNSLPGTVSNYQLCVGHDGEEEMYALIGHELPFSILLHALHSTHSHTHTLQQHSDGPNTTKQPTSPRFTLRTKPASYTHSHTGSSLKHKRKKSLIGWALRKGNSSQSEGKNDLNPASNRLFGQPLASICRDGNLPKPVMDLLCVLSHEGPKTLGVFRRSANAKICRVLKEQLNSGHCVPLRGESVLTAASLLTEFLRKLPGSVLGCDLYEDWMEVLKGTEQQDRCAKSVLAKLPQENRSLLCYVFGMLHRIHTHSDVTQMTAANLALCISPNMLWKSSPCSAEQESQNNLEVAALVQFLIESSPAIFGDEMEATFAMLLKAAQETDDPSADALFLPHSSSEDTDQDLYSPLHSPDLDAFLPLTTLHKEVHPFKITMAAMDGTYSCGTLNLTASRSSASVSSLGIGELSLSHSRCLSEPSMCSATPGTKVALHVPVLRQSSCDNAMRHGKIGPSQDLIGFSPLLQARKGVAGKGRYAFWKSPQFSTRFRHPAQRLASMSSLSSTTTTSSLSSLDSAMSVGSTEPIPSPSDNQSRPFLFGAAARLHPLTPEMPRKLWKMAFTFEDQEAEMRDEQNLTGEGNFPTNCQTALGKEGKGEDEREKDKEKTMGGRLSRVLATEKNNDVESEMNKKGSRDTLVEGEEVIDGEDAETPGEERKNGNFDNSTSDLEGHFVLKEGIHVPVSGSEQTVCCISSVDTCPGWGDLQRLCHTYTSGEGISQEDLHQLIPENENRDLELSHSFSCTESCTVHTQIHNQSQNQRETSVAQIRLERPCSNSDARIAQTSANTKSPIQASRRDRVNRMKITFFPTVGKVTLKQSRVKSLGAPGVLRDENMVTMETECKSGGVGQVSIPQTLFYRQNVPLVLRSAPSSNESVAQTEGCVFGVSKATEDDASSGFSSAASADSSCHIQDLDEVKAVNQSAGDVIKSDTNNVVNISTSDSMGHTVSISTVDISNSVSISPSHANQPDLSVKSSSKNPGTFRHTIRIRLPTNVRNTVRAYFGHAQTLPHASPHSAVPAHTPTGAQNRLLCSSKVHWPGGNNQAHSEEGIVASQPLSD